MIQSSYLKGIISELYVLAFLVLKGYKPVKWRLRNSISEIDLIVKKEHSLIAFEIKYRKKIDDGLYAITPKQQQNIRRAFDLFASGYPHRFDTLRCDICVVNRNGFIHHLKNAF